MFAGSNLWAFSIPFSFVLVRIYSGVGIMMRVLDMSMHVKIQVHLDIPRFTGICLAMIQK